MNIWFSHKFFIDMSTLGAVNNNYKYELTISNTLSRLVAIL